MASCIHASESRLKQLQRFSQGSDCQDFHPRDRLFGHIALGNDRFAETMFDCLLQPLLTGRDRANFAGQPHFTETDQILRYRPIAERAA